MEYKKIIALHGDKLIMGKFFDHLRNKYKTHFVTSIAPFTNNTHSRNTIGEKYFSNDLLILNYVSEKDDEVISVPKIYQFLSNNEKILILGCDSKILTNSFSFLNHELLKNMVTEIQISEEDLISDKFNELENIVCQRLKLINDRTENVLLNKEIKLEITI